MVTVEDDVILYKNCIKLTNIQQGPRHKSTTNVVCAGTNHKRLTTFFLYKHKDKYMKCVDKNYNKQFFSMKGQGQKYCVC